MDGGPDLLKLVGEILYGERWQTPLARDLGVTDRTVRNWCAEKHDCPHDLAERLLPILLERSERVLAVITTIERKLGGIS